MGIVTTHTEGRVVTHSDDQPVEVVQLPSRDAAAAPAAADTPTASAAPATPPAAPAKQTPAVKAAVKQQRARIAKGKK